MQEGQVRGTIEENYRLIRCCDTLSSSSSSWLAVRFPMQGANRVASMGRIGGRRGARQDEKMTRTTC